MKDVYISYNKSVELLNETVRANKSNKLTYSQAKMIIRRIYGKDKLTPKK